jgi:hypothetical protein
MFVEHKLWSVTFFAVKITNARSTLPSFSGFTYDARFHRATPRRKIRHIDVSINCTSVGALVHLIHASLRTII